jgi:hypothetical protein
LELARLRNKLAPEVNISKSYALCSSHHLRFNPLASCIEILRVVYVIQPVPQFVLIRPAQKDTFGHAANYVFEMVA